MNYEHAALGARLDAHEMVEDDHKHSGLPPHKGVVFCQAASQHKSYSGDRLALLRSAPRLALINSDDEAKTSLVSIANVCA